MIFKIIQGIVNLVNSNGDVIETSDDVLNSSVKRLDVNTGTETLNNNGDRAHRVIISEADPADQPGPSDITLSNNQVEEGSSIGTLIGTFTSINGLGPFTWAITDDPDSKFDIQNGNELVVDGILDFNLDNDHNVTIEVTDANLKTYEKTFVIEVLEAQDVVDKQINLNGIDEFVTSDMITEINQGDLAFTVCFEVERFRENVEESILSLQNTSGNKKGFRIFFNSSNNLVFGFYEAQNNGFELLKRTSPNYGVNDRIFVAITYDGSKTIGGFGIRVNSSGTGTTTVSNTLNTGDITSGNANARFCAHSDSSDYFQGFFDNFMLFNRVLTNAEISDLYNSGTPLEDLTSLPDLLTVNIIHVPINDVDIYPTLIDKRGNYNLTMNGNMSQGNIV
jgi:hypothetical protein